LTKETQHIIFYAHIHVGSRNYTDEQWNILCMSFGRILKVNLS